MKIVRYIKSLANNHVDINTFKKGEDFDLQITGEDKYPLLYLEEPILGTATRNTMVWSVNILILSQQLSDLSNEECKMDETFEIMHQIVEKIKQDKIYTVQDGWTILSVTEFGDDITTGWRIELQLIDSLPVNRCIINDKFVELD